MLYVVTFAIGFAAGWAFFKHRTAVKAAVATAAETEVKNV